MEVVDYISRNVEANYYILKGIVVKLIARLKNSGKSIDILTVKELISDITMQISEANGSSEAYVPDTVVIAKI